LDSQRKSPGFGRSRQRGVKILYTLSLERGGLQFPRGPDLRAMAEKNHAAVPPQGDYDSWSGIGWARAIFARASSDVSLLVAEIGRADRLPAHRSTQRDGKPTPGANHTARLGDISSVDNVLSLRRSFWRRRRHVERTRQMLRRFVGLIGDGFALAMVSTTAFAIPTVKVPEPSTAIMMASGGIAVGAAYAVNRWIRRK
jgi:hypothetical protein